MNTETTENHQVGDYLFQDLIANGAESLLWSATQVSISRPVVICNLREEFLQNEAVRSPFLVNMKAKAQVDHPQIGSVLEAVTDEVKCFYAMDKLQGENLAALYQKQEPFTPLETAKTMGSIAQAYLFLESQSIATSPLALHDLFIENKSVAHLNNMAVQGQFNHLVHDQDKQLIGQAFKNLLTPELPGATRIRSLLDYIIGTEAEPPISWQHILKLSDQVKHELEEASLEPEKEVSSRSQQKLVAVLLGVTILAIVVAWLMMK